MTYILIESVTLWLLGGYIASFIMTTMKARNLKESNLVKSVCWKCRHPLNVVDLFPVFGYFIRRGKCHYCGTSITIEYTLVELVNSIAFLILGFNYKLGIFVSLALFTVIYIKEKLYNKED